MGGPIPAGCQREKEEPAATSGSGWEEPSPESIRRRMEIDDGTAAWGEPGRNPGERSHPPGPLGPLMHGPCVKTLGRRRCETLVSKGRGKSRKCSGKVQIPKNCIEVQ